MTGPPALAQGRSRGTQSPRGSLPQGLAPAPQVVCSPQRATTTKLKSASGPSLPLATANLPSCSPCASGSLEAWYLLVFFPRKSSLYVPGRVVLGKEAWQPRCVAWAAPQPGTPVRRKTASSRGSGQVQPLILRPRFLPPLPCPSPAKAPKISGGINRAGQAETGGQILNCFLSPSQRGEVLPVRKQLGCWVRVSGGARRGMTDGQLRRSPTCWSIRTPSPH